MTQKHRRGWHGKAGTSRDRLIQIHGTNSEIECQTCGERSDPEPHFDFFRETGRPPACPCGGFLKSATISFGQDLVAADLRRAAEMAARTDLAVALGSTLGVYPAASIPLMAAERGAPYVIVNRGETDQDAHPGVTLRLEGSGRRTVRACMPRGVPATPADQPEVEMTEPDLKSLTRIQLDQFHQKGFLAIGPLLEEGEVRELREEYDRLFAEARETARMRNLSSADGEATTEANEEMLQIMQMCERSILYRRLLYDDRLLDIAEDLIGPNLQLFHDQALYKPPRHGGPHPLAPGQRLLEVPAGEPRQLLADPRTTSTSTTAPCT